MQDEEDGATQAADLDLDFLSSSSPQKRYCILISISREVRMVMLASDYADHTAGCMLRIFSIVF